MLIKSNFVRDKIENFKRLDRKLNLLEELYERNYIDSNESVVLADGFENAIIGVTDESPKRVAYDYWVCIDIILQSKKNDTDFDEAVDWLDAFSLLNNKKGKRYPVFVKTLSPKLNYKM